MQVVRRGAVRRGSSPATVGKPCCFAVMVPLPLVVRVLLAPPLLLLFCGREASHAEQRIRSSMP